MTDMSINCKVSDIAIKKLNEDDDGEVTFSIKATVARFPSDDGYGDDDKNVSIEIQGIDIDGFERISIFLGGKVPVGTTKTLTQKETYYDGDFDEITSWTPKFDD